MSEPALQDLLDLAVEAAYLGGKHTLKYFNAGVDVETKADNTPVTRADREAEQLIRDRILKTYPAHSVVGEEHGAQQGDSDYKWIIDPIDGTKSFIHGVPLYGVLIGVEVKGMPSVGVIYLPATDQMVSAAEGLGCRANGKQARVSNTTELSEATLLTTSVASCMARSDAYERLAGRVKLVRTWGDAFGYFLVATGRAEIMLDPGVNPWDIAPLGPILREAGGKFSAWDGQVTAEAKDAVGVNSALYDEVLAVLKSEKVR